MGSVYRARDRRLDRDVALKVLRAEVMADRDRQMRFVQEAKAASAFNHPNIVTIYDVGADGDLTYVVMELVDGRALDQLIPRGGMRPAEVLRIGAQIADAFANAHARQIVHRDLKPANVMLQADGRIKVLDFGLAKVVESDRDAGLRAQVTQTAAGTIMGTAAYMSPEQAEGRAVDSRSDIFSFGALRYELATGVRAFRGDSQASVIADVLRQDPKPLAELRPDLPPELTRLNTRCLRTDPARRGQSMADLKVALDELRDEADAGKVTPAGGRHQRPVTAPRVPSFAWAAAIVAAIVAGLLIGQRRTVVPAPTVVALQPVPLTSYPGNEEFPSVSPDGNEVVFNWDGEQGGNRATSSARGRPTAAGSTSAPIAAVAWRSGACQPAAASPNRSRETADKRPPFPRTTPGCTTRNGTAPTVWRMPVGGGQESRVVDAVFRYNYAPTAEGVYFVSAKPPDLGLALSPDGRYLLFTRLDYLGTDLMLVENFR